MLVWAVCRTGEGADLKHVFSVGTMSAQQAAQKFRYYNGLWTVMSRKERHSVSMALKFVLEGGPLRKKCLVMLRGVAIMRKRPRNTDLSDNVTSLGYSHSWCARSISGLKWKGRSLLGDPRGSGMCCESFLPKAKSRENATPGSSWIRIISLMR